ncbi:MgtC/SapB family protein [Chloroflexi bacterium CFX6]|nr:MgtC/SapB family protein [Chloroflexi bacterium CFX6]
MNIPIENLIKLGMAVLIGGVIGAEREFQDKAAGLRTIILITVGSTLFTIFSLSMDPHGTPTRVAANIVTGIGFLGAGAIIREGRRIAGLTTAATIWLAAALGMGIGAGELPFVSASTLMVIVVLLVFPLLERRIDRMREARSYKVVIASGGVQKMETIRQALKDCSLRVIEQHQAKSDEVIIGIWRTIGSFKNHERFMEFMLKDEGIREISY